MSNPADADTQNKRDPEDKSEPTFADRVNTVVKELKQGTDGKWVLPEDLDEPTRYAVIAEKRLRDTQASFTKNSQELKVLKAENTILLEKATGNVQVELTDEQAEELETLKFEDPEAWRKKMNSYERAALEKHKQELTKTVQEVSAGTLEEEEKERRKELLDSFLKDHEGFELNDDVISNDIPPRIVKKLENGDITFEDFLQECYDYTQKGKVLKQDELLDQPNMNKVGGGNIPDKNAVKEDILTSYKSETY